MNAGQYLQENFPGGVRKYQEITSSTGEIKGYYVQGNNGDEMYLPANVSGNVGMLSYIPGSGGSGNDAKKIRERLLNDPPEYPITIAASCSDHQNCMEVGYSLAQGANMNVTNNVTVCFSASGYLGINRTESFEDNHPDVTSTVISCEPYNTGAYSYSDENNRNGLINSNSQVIFVAPRSGFHVNMQEEIKKMTNSGMNAYFLGTSYKNAPGSVHVMTNADVLTSGMVDFLLGYSDSFDIEPGDDRYSPNYQLVQFNKDTGEYETMDYDDLASAIKAIRIPDIEKLKLVDPFNITTKISPVHNKYAGLANVNRKELSGTTMKTSYTYASSEMNNIRDLVRTSSFVNNFSNQTFRSGEGIPGCIGAYLNAYFDVVGSLLNSIALETDSVMSYTEAAIQLDADLANSLSGGEIVQNSKLEGFIPIGLEEEKKDNNTSDNSQVPTNTHQSGGGSTGGGYIPTIEETPIEKEPNYIYDFDDGHQALIYEENGKVNKISFRYTYNTETEASSHLDEIKEKYKETEYIKEVVQVGTYVEAVFKEEAYENKTVDKIVEEYFEGGKLHG